MQHIDVAPYIICGLLLLAGFSLPISEDAMILLSVVLGFRHPEARISLYIFLFLGIYLSDLIAYWVGRILGVKLWNYQFFNKMLSRSKIDSIQHYYNKHGMFTLIVGRFIPFGVRNALFISAGISKMNFMKFAFFDFLAAVISTTTFVTIYTVFGKQAMAQIGEANKIIISIFIVVVLVFLFRKKLFKKQ
jgi:membrane protein DedA with SNARE-associated domain